MYNFIVKIYISFIFFLSSKFKLHFNHFNPTFLWLLEIVLNRMPFIIYFWVSPPAATKQKTKKNKYVISLGKKTGQTAAAAAVPAAASTVHKFNWAATPPPPLNSSKELHCTDLPSLVLMPSLPMLSLPSPPRDCVRLRRTSLTSTLTTRRLFFGSFALA